MSVPYRHCFSISFIPTHSSVFLQRLIVERSTRSPKTKTSLTRSNATMSAPTPPQRRVDAEPLPTSQKGDEPQATSLQSGDDPLVQYVVVRRDLMDQWPTGSVIAQAVHASIAAVWQSRETSNTTTYCNQPGNAETASGFATQMHTVVLEAKNEAALSKLADSLRAADVHFAVWREQPENILTALAAQPYPRSAVKKYFSKFRLFK